MPLNWSHIISGKAPIKPTRTYHLHRDRQRRRILEAARKLFDERGIDRTTMAEVMTASGLQASTLYEYFSRKDEIVWAIFGDMLAEDAESVKKRLEDASTGLSKITALLQHMADQLSMEPAKVRFMAQFDAIYARAWPVERMLTLEGQLNDQGFKVFGTLIREGMADGSLRPDLNTELTLHAVVNAVIGAQRRLASLGTKVEVEYGQPIDRLFQETIRIFLLGLSAPPLPDSTLRSSRAVARIRTTRKRIP